MHDVNIYSTVNIVFSHLGIGLTTAKDDSATKKRKTKEAVYTINSETSLIFIFLDSLSNLSNFIEFRFHLYFVFGSKYCILHLLYVALS